MAPASPRKLSGRYANAFFASFAVCLFHALDKLYGQIKINLHIWDASNDYEAEITFIIDILNNKIWQ
ncbi:hypothetical protein [Anabaena azotica]|uniref:hypothetical protein n=1 Tax=Anabaena azotica TaxID=197653 RepID=UPI0039A6CB07